jgi:hypothetical protein
MIGGLDLPDGGNVQFKLNNRMGGHATSLGSTG